MPETKMHLKVWPLNAARILDRLIDKVYDAGGYLVFGKDEVHEVVDDFVPGQKTLYLRTLTYISFVLSGHYYYVRLGNNPMLEISYAKEPTDGETITAVLPTCELPLAPWFTGDEYEYMNSDEIEENAKNLLAFLMFTKPTQEVKGKDRRKIR